MVVERELAAETQRIADNVGRSVDAAQQSTGLVVALADSEHSRGTNHAVHRHVLVGEPGATLDVEKRAVPSVAETAGQRGKPVELRVAAHEERAEAARETAGVEARAAAAGLTA